jgi:hypothetical protein
MIIQNDRGGFCFDAGDGEEVFDGFGEAVVAVDPVFLQVSMALGVLASASLR